MRLGLTQWPCSPTARSSLSARTPSPHNSDFAVARYNTDGSLDTTFGTGGTVITDFGDDAAAFDVALQSDGKIIAVGRSGVNTYHDFALARYNPDGSLDTTFGTGGTVTTNFEGDEQGDPWDGDDEANGVALQPDGKIVVVGGGAPGVGAEFALARYNTDGSLDTTFGTGGTVTSGFGVAFGVALQPDGKIVAVGVFSSQGGFALARYNSDGSLDTTFGTDGKATADFGSGSILYGVALQTDGKIIAVGSGGPSDNRRSVLTRYNSDGSLDTTFGTGGTVTTDFGGRDWTREVALQTDGKIIAVGTGGAIGNLDFALARYNSDGSLDATFGTGGKVTTDFGGDSGASGVALQTDGKIIAVGSNGDFALARYQGDSGASAGVDVSVAKAGPATVKVGHRVSYTVTVTNNSTTAPATGLTLTDTLTGPGRLRSVTPSQGTCTRTTTSASCVLGTLAPGTSATVTVVVQPTATGTISDTATAHAAEPDPAQENNSATATTTVSPKKCHPGKHEGHHKPR
ncbi:hypothetical protein ACFZDI_11025 [Streptomyces sp. NPDC007907]|uniref:hypothetical protein n=1 Tax=Streptomyces sp. NPDC007907 TaxID=3364789 RepID=UPI0036EC0504